MIDRLAKMGVPVQQVRMVSHRASGMRSAPESLPAVQEALEVGFTDVEVDVRRTKDGVLIVCHDNFVRSTSGKILSVVDSVYSDIELPEIGLPLKFTQLLAFCSCEAGRGVEITLHVDIKFSGGELEVIDAIRDQFCLDRVIIVSWLPEVLQAVNNLSPSLRLAYSFIPVSGFVIGCLWIIKRTRLLNLILALVSLLSRDINAANASKQLRVLVGGKLLHESKLTPVETISFLSEVRGTAVGELVNRSGGYFCVPRWSLRLVSVTRVFEPEQDIAVFPFAKHGDISRVSVPRSRLIAYMDGL